MAKPTDKQMQYWKDREHAYENYLKQVDESVAERMNRNLMEAKADVQKQINDLFEKYSNNGNISIEDAHVAVNQFDVKAYEAKAKELVQEARRIEREQGRKATRADFNEKDNADLRLYNLTMRVNQLELANANINLTLSKATLKNQDIINNRLKDSVLETTKRQSGILGQHIELNGKDVSAIVNGDYQATKFSDNLWNNNRDMVNEITSTLRRAVTAGVNPVVGASAFQRQFEKTIGKNSFNAKRLLINETARVQADAHKASYEKSGYTKYIYMAESHACDICKTLDGKVFDVGKMQPGENCFPMHPFCHCSTAPYADREEMERLIKIANEETLRNRR